ncbi:MAG: BMC domain-containing protein, partial [Phycisphaeraceae bacterium]
ALGVIEVVGFCPAMVILDRVEKAANVQLLQAELNDYYGLVVKVQGDPAALRAAIAAGEEIARRMHADCVTTIIDAPDREAWKAIEAPREYQPLIEQDIVYIPEFHRAAPQTASASKEHTVSEGNQQFAIGLIETQGFTAVIEAIDTACKAANVEVIGKEKLGGGYVTVLIKGDVAAVEAAVASGRERVGNLGKLIAAHVIARPSDSILALLPK